MEAGEKNWLVLRDGRRLAWHEWGPKAGYPVIFCTGAGMSGSLGFGLEFLDELRLRLISVDRPGLGGSDPHPGKTLLSWCEDVSELLSALKVAVLPLGVGFSQGAPFAFALASEGLLQAVAIVSGQDEFSRSDTRNRLPLEVAQFVAQVQSGDPTFLQEFSRRVDAEGFFRLIVSMSGEKDRKLYETEPFGSAFLECLRDGFRQSSGQSSNGYVRDLLNCLSAWPFELEKIQVPVDFWYGKLDMNMTHSPDFGLSLSRRIPNHSYVCDPNEGGSILWTRSRDILEKLIRSGRCSGGVHSSPLCRSQK